MEDNLAHTLTDSLDLLGLRYGRLDNDHFVMGFQSQPGEPDMSIVVGIEGRVVAVRAASPEATFAIDIADALTFCSRWNAENRWPSAHVIRPIDQNPLVVAGEVHMPIVWHPTVDHLRDIVALSINASREFVNDLQVFCFRAQRCRLTEHDLRNLVSDGDG